MFGVQIFGQSPFGSVSTYDGIIASPPSPSFIVKATAALSTTAEAHDNHLKVTASTRLKITATLAKTDFT